MLDLFRSRKTPLSTSQQEQLKQIETILGDMLGKIDLRFNELSAQIREVELGLEQLEVKLLTKDLRDKQQLGAIHYKLHERTNAKLEGEISGVEVELSSKKRPRPDQ